uniref:Uncharacterized protein n=1 Tax=Spermophilus dauricus TaxID=99837 RepID=A0A8C9P1H8_SPEDA
MGSATLSEDETPPLESQAGAALEGSSLGLPDVLASCRSRDEAQERSFLGGLVAVGSVDTGCGGGLQGDSVQALPAVALPLSGPEGAGGGQGAEGQLRGRDPELEATQLLLPPPEGPSAALVLCWAAPRGPQHRGRPGGAEWPATPGDAPWDPPDPAAAGGRGTRPGDLRE